MSVKDCFSGAVVGCENVDECGGHANQASHVDGRQPISRKRSKAVQKMISHSSQHPFSIGALGENAGYRHGTHHRTKNDAKVLLSHPGRRAGHELHPLSRSIFHQAGDSFPDSELGASNLRCQLRNRAAGIGMITVFGECCRKHRRTPALSHQCALPARLPRQPRRA